MVERGSSNLHPNPTSRARRFGYLSDLKRRLWIFRRKPDCTNCEHRIPFLIQRRSARVN
jgi:hypothetical protein